jgi:regulatory protein
MDLKTAIYRYCNYQERSHQEVRDKLYELGAYTGEVNQLIAELIEVDLLNEERFARSFARGRFKLKQWGRVKIIQHLKQHRISDYLLKKALKEIDASEYFETAKRLASRKWESLKTEKDQYTRKNKVFRYLLQKGYESSLIGEVLTEIISLE